MRKIEGKMKIEKIYVFGDSIHDAGNLYKATNQEQPSKNYYQGRFSNGPVYCEYIAAFLSEQTGRNISLNNFAYGGALTKYRNGYEPMAISLKDQIELKEFIFTEQDLVIFGCGPNNYGFFFDIHEFPFLHLKRIKTISKDIEFCVKRVIEKGAKNILVFNVPDIFEAPVKKKLSWLFKVLIAPLMEKSLVKTNIEIEAMVDALNSSEIKACVFDVHKIYMEALSSPEKYGFTNSNNSIIPGMGRYNGNISTDKNKEDYIFWDYVHPTTKAHKMLADYLRVLINEKFNIE